MSAKQSIIKSLEKAQTLMKKHLPHIKVNGEPKFSSISNQKDYDNISSVINIIKDTPTHQINKHHSSNLLETDESQLLLFD